MVKQANYDDLTGLANRMLVRDRMLEASKEAIPDLLKWVGEGKLHWQADVQQGFENAPKTLQRLYTGANFGKQLLEF